MIQPTDRASIRQKASHLCGLCGIARFSKKLAPLAQWVEAERVHADQLFRYLETVEDKFVQATKSICDRQKARVGPCKATYGDAKKKLAVSLPLHPRRLVQQDKTDSVDPSWPQKARKASEKNPVLDVADELRMLEAEQEAVTHLPGKFHDVAARLNHAALLQTRPSSADDRLCENLNDMCMILG
jgi:hypothetical protein